MAPGAVPGIEVLLDLLGKSLVRRSQGHLEAALHLIEVQGPVQSRLLRRLQGHVHSST